MKPSFLALTAACVLVACSVESGDGNPEPSDVDAAAGGGDAAPPSQSDAAVGPVDLTEFCNQWNTAACAHVFACLTPEERDAAGIPPTEEECVSAQSAECEEANSESYCDFGETYHADQSPACLDQFIALTCEQFLDPDHDAVMAAAAPACVAMCQ
jgi:hypothetical protein